MRIEGNGGIVVTDTTLGREGVATVATKCEVKPGFAASLGFITPRCALGPPRDLTAACSAIHRFKLFCAVRHGMQKRSGAFRQECMKNAVSAAGWFELFDEPPRALEEPQLFTRYGQSQYTPLVVTAVLFREGTPASGEL